MAPVLVGRRDHRRVFNPGSHGALPAEISTTEALSRPQLSSRATRIWSAHMAQLNRTTAHVTVHAKRTYISHRHERAPNARRWSLMPISTLILAPFEGKRLVPHEKTSVLQSIAFSRFLSHFPSAILRQGKLHVKRLLHPPCSHVWLLLPTEWHQFRLNFHVRTNALAHFAINRRISNLATHVSPSRLPKQSPAGVCLGRYQSRWSLEKGWEVISVCSSFTI